MITTPRLRAVIARRICDFGCGRMEIHSAVLEALVRDAEEGAKLAAERDARARNVLIVGALAPDEVCLDIFPDYPPLKSISVDDLRRIRAAVRRDAPKRDGTP